MKWISKESTSQNHVIDKSFLKELSSRRLFNRKKARDFATFKSYIADDASGLV